jgi:tRNA threonylcarbamoyl adenosine modification protein (Sua5/YciO/YrdC/YwlC family)
MKTEIIQINPHEPEIEKVKRAATVLKEGGLVVIPTDTVYGIAANMLNNKAIQRLYAVKQRPKDKPFSIHIASGEVVKKYAVDILPAAYRLMERFWPGPLTLILKSQENDRVGIRMPNHRVALSIINAADIPIVCPSANLSGKPASVKPSEALKDLDGLVDLILDAGPAPLGRESTIADVTKLPIEILREGVLSKDEIEKVVNTKIILFVCTGNSCRSVMAKALLEKKLKEKGRQDIEVLSAGMMMLGGLGPTNETKELLNKEGIDVSNHHSQMVNKDMIKKSDIILIMEKLHEERILKLVPEAKFRLFLLKEFAKIKDNNLDIADPIGKSMEFYTQTFATIKEAITRVAEII